MKDNAISVAATGQTTTTTISTATAMVALPNTSAASKPRYVRFTATGTCYVRLGIAAGAVAVTTDAMVSQHSPLILMVGTATHWSAIDDGVSVKVNVTPLEDN